MSSKAGRRARADAEGRLSKNTTVKARIWLEKDGETFLASGRVALLERIDKYGSVTKAANSLRISYRHAWLLLEAMNRLSERPLVETKVGGTGGGGARLTDEGRRVVKNFHSLKEKLQKFMSEKALRT